MTITQFVHAVPNFSEGKRKEVIKAVVDPLCGAQGVKLIDYYPDPDFNRDQIIENHLIEI